MTTLPALTVWQPWASLIAACAKPDEFRGHCCARIYWSRRIAIHAGKRKPRITEMRELLLRLRSGDETGLIPEIAVPLLNAWLLTPGVLPLSSIICTAYLGEPKLASEVPRYAHAFVNDSERQDLANWAWPLTEVRPLEPPVPYRGAQGFWRCELEQAS